MKNDDQQGFDFQAGNSFHAGNPEQEANTNGNENQGESRNGSYEFQNRTYDMPPVNAPFPPQQQQTSNSAQTLGIVGLVLSILCCALAGIILGILAIVKASAEKTATGTLSPSANAGKICGILAIILGCIMMLSTSLLYPTFYEIINDILMETKSGMYRSIPFIL